MTEEERKKLCAKLRREYYDGEYAASEIERLAAQMTDLEALEITYNIAVRYFRGPLTDEEMDALLKVRATIEQTKENPCNTKISSSSAMCSTPQSNRF